MKEKPQSTLQASTEKRYHPYETHPKVNGNDDTHRENGHSDRASLSDHQQQPADTQMMMDDQLLELNVAHQRTLVIQDDVTSTPTPEEYISDLAAKFDSPSHDIEIYMCRQLIPYDIIMYILRFLDLRNITLARLLSKKLCQQIDEDRNGILWRHVTKKQEWLSNLHCKNLVLELNKRKHKWMRFLSIFSDNECEWENSPNYHEDITNKLLLCTGPTEALDIVQDTKYNITTSTRKYTALMMDDLKNVSCASSYPITSNTVKFFEVTIDKKSSTWNIGIGLAQKDFLLSKRKFVGFNAQNFGYSSNGYMRHFCTRTQANYVQHAGFPSYGSGDKIGILVDMPSERVNIYLNGVFLYTFEKVLLENQEPLRIVATLHTQYDQVTLSHQQDCMFDVESLLQIYDSVEQSLENYMNALRNAKENFMNHIHHLLSTCDRAEVYDMLTSLIRSKLASYSSEQR
ncbi:hypothetical protein C9374_001245 [Naegleria lovaniensis]|uniref:B30.2/SPRY domain-containing protein n=1 Tax=Naegleria lovaniensis TaxID=51637 RepID=A0AA88GXB2_NAELO|nr:uncharacterized protein C9374_001245 [Naegleria lovaniensis]KAG2387651.1 hypothetical protein C9374_001245 [Naegleria lovaniensis]